MKKPALWLGAVLLVVLLVFVFGSRPAPPTQEPRPEDPPVLSEERPEPVTPPAGAGDPSSGGSSRVVDAPPPPGTVVYGRVTTEEGKPVTSAVVEVRDWYVVVGGADLDRAERLLTPESKQAVSEKGTWALQRTTGTDTMVVTVRAPGFVPVTWEIEEIPVDPVAVRKDVRMRPAGTLSGRIIGPRGDPVAGAHVHAIEASALREHQVDDALPEDRPMVAARDLLWGDGRWDETVCYRRTFAVTDAEGRFRMTEADPSEEYVLLAVGKSHGLSEPVPGIRHSTADDGAPVVLQLRRMAGVRVRIFDTAGRLVTDAEVTSVASPRRRPKFELNREGVHRHRALDPGDQRLLISIPGWPEITHDVCLRPGETTETDARMEGGGIVSGVVLDERERPIPGAEIQLQVEPPSGVNDITVTRAESDEKGRFVLEGNPEGSGDMWISRDGYENVVLRDLEVPVGGLRIILREAGTVLVEVKAPEGAKRTKWVNYAIRSQRTGHEPGGWSEDFTHWAGKDEPLEIEGVPTGGAEIRFWAPGCRLVAVRAEVEAGKPCRLGPVRMQRAPTLVVIVVDEKDEPVVGAEIGFDAGRHPPVQWRELDFVTDEDGRATIQFPVDEPLSMYVGAAGRKGIRHTVEAGDTPVRVRAGAPK